MFNIFNAYCAICANNVKLYKLCYFYSYSLGGSSFILQLAVISCITTVLMLPLLLLIF